MSDMPRPGPRPPAAPDHERHDALLVAQFVARDPLKPEQQAEAQRLIAGCGACAALAAELPAISRAVAQEPVPPRRRDFRLSPEQAEELQGNALSRFLRRLSLPSSRAFQPAAAGVLSIGLLFVVAGYAWPDGGTVVVQAEPNFIDWSSPAATLVAPTEAFAEEPAAPRAAQRDSDEADEADALAGAERLMESEFAESLVESQAGMSDGGAQKPLAEAEGARSADDAAESLEFEVQELGAVADAVEESAADATEDVVQAPADDAGTDMIEELASDEVAADAVAEPVDSAAVDAVQKRAADEVAAGAVDDESTDLSARSVAPSTATTGEGAVEDVPEVASEVEALADDGSPEDLLMVLGLALVLTGGGLLLLGWLARRTRDPLAP